MEHFIQYIDISIIEHFMQYNTIIIIISRAASTQPADPMPTEGEMTKGPCLKKINKTEYIYSKC